MTNILVRCTLKSANGRSADDCVNTFAVTVPNEAVTTPEQLTDKFDRFYNGLSGGSTRLSTFINGSIRREDGLVLELIESPESPPNVPFFTRVYDLPPPAVSTSLPQEVACCLSFNDGGYAAAANKGRHRGRIYFGPLVTTAAATGTGGIARPEATLVQSLTDRGRNLINELNDVDADWCVWSRVNGTFLTVQGGWVDNEFDTQRRRGHERTGRTFWSGIAPPGP